MVSDPAVPSVSLSVKRSAFTSASVPLMVRVVPAPDTVFPAPPVLVAESTPWVSVSVAVKVSPVVLPLSERLTLLIAAALPTPIVCTAATDDSPTLPFERMKSAPVRFAASVAAAPLLPAFRIISDSAPEALS